jgi:predicted dehydrogenase
VAGSGPPATATLLPKMRRMNERRDFLRRAAALAAASFVSGCAAPARRPRAANEKLDLGFVGVANRAAANLGGLAGENVVALCDVDQGYLDAAGAAHPGAKRYADFRAMIERERLDAVVVSSADHTHAPATLMALEAGLDVYCEKPLTHNVREARLVARAARRHRAVTQMGTQIHATGNYRRVVEIVQSGALGAVRECHAWVGKAWGGGELPTDRPPVPPGLHYNAWLGPAAYRPYHPTYLPANWRRWWDFGGGTLGDMGCHLIDLAFWALELRHPVRVAAEGPPVHPHTAPLWMRAHWDFPARRSARGGLLDPVELHWHDGGKLPPQMESGELPARGMGVLFVGEEATLFADYGGWQLFPDAFAADFAAPAPWIPDSTGHYREWADACRGRGATTCDFDYAGALTETVLLGNVAYRCGSAFDWDAASMRTSVAAAQPLLRREYREGWEL